MKINRDNVKWCGRMMAILLLVAIAGALITAFMRHPLPWPLIPAASMPLLTAVFVIGPMMRDGKL